MQWSWGSWGSCAGQWVVCLTCHHSIPVLGGKVSLTFSFLVRLDWKGSQKGDLDWTAFMGWGALNSACPLGWPLWAPPNLGLLVEKWARVFSKGADTSPQLKQTNKHCNMLDWPYSLSWEFKRIVKSHEKAGSLKSRPRLLILFVILSGGQPHWEPAF